MSRSFGGAAGSTTFFSSQSSTPPARPGILLTQPARLGAREAALGRRAEEVVCLDPLERPRLHLRQEQLRVLDVWVADLDDLDAAVRRDTVTHTRAARDAVQRREIPAAGGGRVRV